MSGSLSDALSGGAFALRLRSLVERARSSLFTVPVVWIGAAIGLSQLATWVDVRVGDGALPDFTDTTVESARSILTAISSGTITAASVVFSLTLVAIQMSTSVYTSRVLRSFLRDRFQQHMIGVLLATFTYSLLVLREVRGPLDPDSTDSQSYIPRLSVFLAVLFAIVAVLALLASISHTSQGLRATSVTRQIVGEVVELIEASSELRQPPSEPDDSAGGDQDVAPDPATAMRTSSSDPPGRVLEPGHGAVLTAASRGWVQQIGFEAIRKSIADGSSVRLMVDAGSYVFDGAPLMVLSPPPSPERVDDLMTDLRAAFAIGEQRSLQQDVAFGFMMIEDIANKALSPGVNDPNTAIEVIDQLGEVVLAALEREVPPETLTVDGCRFVRHGVATYDDIVVAAFEQIRHYSVEQPTVQHVMIRTLVRVGDELVRRRRDAPASLDALRTMIGRVEADLTADVPAADAARRVVAGATWLA